MCQQAVVPADWTTSRVALLNSLSDTSECTVYLTRSHDEVKPKRNANKDAQRDLLIRFVKANRIVATEVPGTTGTRSGKVQFYPRLCCYIRPGTP